MSVLRKIKNMPVSIAIIFMIVLVLAGLILGNRNAVLRASKDVYAELANLQSKVAAVSGKANNYLLIAGRHGITGSEVTKLETARDDAERLVKRKIPSLGATAGVQYNASLSALEIALEAVDARFLAEIVNLPEADQNRAKSERDAAYNGWRTERAIYTDIEDYNASVLEFRKAWNGVSFKFLFGSYNFQLIGDE